MRPEKFLVKFIVEYENQFNKIRKYDYYALLSLSGMLHIYNIAYPIKIDEKDHFFRAKLDPILSNKGNFYLYSDNLIAAFIDRCKKLDYPGFQYWCKLKTINIEIKVNKLWYDFQAIKWSPIFPDVVIFTDKIEITKVGDNYAYQRTPKQR